MLMADGGGSGSYIKEAGEIASKLGKTAEDIAFDADGVDKVIQRLEDVIDRQTMQKRVARVSGRAAAREGDAEDWASSLYSNSADTFDENYETWNDEYIKRLEQTVEKFKKVKAHYMSRDDEIGEQFRSGMKK